MKRKKIQQIQKNGDKITQTTTDIVLSFGGKRKVLSTSSLCGGIHTELEAVFNHCDKDFETGRCEMYGNTYADHLCYVAKSIGLNSQKVSGLSTAADLSWASIAKEQLHLQMIYEEKYISPKSMSQEKAETFLSAYKYE